MKLSWIVGSNLSPGYPTFVSSKIDHELFAEPGTLQCVDRDEIFVHPSTTGLVDLDRF
jgi:hypothetical protein